jgi:hypothetical protein
LLKNLEGRDHSEDVGMCRRIMDLKEIGWDDVAWIYLAQDRDWWWVLVNMVMNLQVHKRHGLF